MQKKKTARRIRYPVEIITDADYADNIALLANTSTQAKSMLQNLEQAVGITGLNVNANKTAYQCFKREWAISTLSGENLKIVVKFTYLGSSVSSTENDVNICHVIGYR